MLSGRGVEGGRPAKCLRVSIIVINSDCMKAFPCHSYDVYLMPGDKHDFTQLKRETEYG